MLYCKRCTKVSTTVSDAGANSLVAVWTALSTTAGTVKLYKADGSAAPAGNYATLKIKAEGV